MKTISKYFFALLSIASLNVHCAEETNPSNFDYTHFSQLIYEGDAKKVEERLQAGYNPNSTYLGDPILWRAIVGSRQPVIMTKLLLTYQANPNAELQTCTLLSYACEARLGKSASLLDSEAEIVNLLLNARADINEKSKQGRTPIRDAVRKNPITSADCLHRLLDEPDIELDHPRWKEKPVYNLATHKTFSPAHLSVLARMLALGADPNNQSKSHEGELQTIFTQYRTWISPDYTDPYDDEFEPNLPVIKSALLIFDAHRNNVKKEQKAIKAAILEAPYFAAVEAHLIAEYAGTLIAPDNKELDEALEKYKDIQPI